MFIPQKVVFEEKLKTETPAQIWDEYCGFLDLSLNEYMDIQKRLLTEQINLFANCGLGQRFFKGQVPKTVDEFRKMVPLTKYEDYADVLLLKRDDMLPAPPVVWLSTTWESGNKPQKWAPYSEEMLSIYRTNIIAAMILSTSNEKGKFFVRPGFKALYTLAPLPYATGLFPDLIDSEIKPDVKDEEGRKETKTFIQLLGFKIPLFSSVDSPFEKCIAESKSKRLSIFGISLPVVVEKVLYSETEAKDVFFSESQGEKAAFDDFELWKKREIKGEIISESIESSALSSSGDEFILKASVFVSEDIGEKQFFD